MLLKELLHIPERVGKADFVISLEDGIGQSGRTVDTYVVTPQLADCFDRALGLIDAALSGRASKGAYLHGSFGAGKSHFMAVLHLLLQGDSNARGKPELAPVVQKYDARLRGKRFLLVPYHMIGAASMEAGVLGGYVEHVRRLHPEAALPAVYLDDPLLQSARHLRTQIGDAPFFTNLGSAGGDEGFGELAGQWDAPRFEAALAAPAGAPERAALVSDFIDAYAPYARTAAGATGLGFIQFADGLDAISRHAKSLGYDAVVLFLDELVLWFASRMSDPGFVQREGQKVAKLVEAAAAARPAPIVSFIARQRDLRDFIGQGVPGAERLNFADILKYWEGRFDVIELSDTNLRAIVEKRLLRPKDDAAARALDDAFDSFADKARGAFDTLLTSDADRAEFRRVYPFSPATIETLVAVSGYLQRERTALRLLLQLLVEKRDTLQVGDLVPTGDLYDIIRGGEEPFSDELKRHFVRARDLYEARLRPMLLVDHGIAETDIAGLPQRHPFRTDDRIVKTLLLAALVPSVEPLRALTVRRLADLNYGTIRSPIPGNEKAAVLARLRQWAPEVPELQVRGDEHDPTVAIQLTGVDVQSILDQAAHVDSAGARKAKIRQMVFDALELTDNGLFAATHKWIWRGTKREADVRFANVRDETDIPDSEFKAQGRPRVLIDFPFDEVGQGPADDLARMNDLRDALDRPSPTVAWLPLFMSEHALERLGRLVILDHVLTGDRLEGYTQHLPAQDRVQAAQLLRNQAESLRMQLSDVLRQAYGIQTREEQWVRGDVLPRDQFPTLDPTLDVRAPTAADMGQAFGQILDQVMAHLYPAHPDFGADEVRLADLRGALEYVEKAVADRDQRVDVPQPDRKAVRRALGPLNLATVAEAHIVLKRAWRDHFHRMQHQQPGVAVTVERLRKWIDEPKSMGLPEPVANLVVCSYALMDNRVLVLDGQVIEPDLRQLEPRVELRTQRLPSQDAWDAARQRVPRIFGVDASPLLNATNVARIASAVRGVAAEHAEACRVLAERLGQDITRAGANGDADRVRTAAAARDLLEAVQSAGDDVVLIEQLARANLPTTPEALGRSMKSAGAVAGALQRVNWTLFDTAASLPRAFGERGQMKRDALRDTFTRDELAKPLAPDLDRLEKEVTQLIADAMRGTQPPSPPPTPPSPPTQGRLEPAGQRSGLEGKAAEPVLRELLERKGELASLDVNWKFKD